MTLTETMLEYTYKILQSSWKWATLKLAVQLSKAVQFWVTFNV